MEFEENNSQASSCQQEESTDSGDLKIAIQYETRAVIGQLVNPNKPTRYLIEIVNFALAGHSTNERLCIWYVAGQIVSECSDA